MKTKIKYAIILITSIMSQANMPLAGAFQTQICPNGVPAVWEDAESEEFLVDSGAFPTGSPQRQDVSDQFAEWEAVAGSNFNFAFAFFPNTDGGFSNSDEQSEVVLVNSTTMTQLSGQTNTLGLAMTSTQYSTQGTPWCNIVAVDVAFNTGFTWEFGDVEDFDPVTMRRQCNGMCFKDSVVHEFGHALGLNHTTNYGFMVSGQATGGAPHAGNHPFIPLPDDRGGIRSLYPSDGSEDDLALSHYQPDSTNSSGLTTFDPLNSLTVIGVCPGDQIRVERTALNLGSYSEFAEIDYYFSKNTNITESDHFADDEIVDLAAESDQTDSFMVTVPNGLSWNTEYFIGGIIDADEMADERLSSNNREVLRAKVQTAGFSDCAVLASGRIFEPEEDSPFSLGLGNHDFGPAPAWLLELLRQSIDAILGRVIDITSYRTAGGAIFSDITVEVAESVTGQSNEVITLTQFGGAIEDEKSGLGTQMFMEGAPALEVGQEYIMMINKNQNAWIPFAAGEKGIFKIGDGDQVRDYFERELGQDQAVATGEFLDFMIGELGAFAKPAPEHAAKKTSFISTTTKWGSAEIICDKCKTPAASSAPLPIPQPKKSPLKK